MGVGPIRRLRAEGSIPGWLLSAILIALLVGPISAAWAITRGNATLIGELTPPAEPVLMHPVPSVMDLDSAATLQGFFGAATHLTSSGAQGVLTDVSMTPGQAINPGTLVYRVNGIGVLAYLSDYTFYRPLQWGDRGPDVSALQALLNAGPVNAGMAVDGFFGAAAERGVRELEALLGVPRATGVFSQQYVVRLPSGDFIPSELAVRQDAAAPSAGVPVATQAPTIERIDIRVAAPLPDEGYTFTSNGRSLTVGREKDLWTISDPQLARDMLTQGETNDNAVSLDGRVRLQETRPAQLVPASAVIGGDTTAPCIYLALSDGKTHKARSITIVQSDVTGAAILEPDLPETSWVLVNPRAVVGDVECPSN